MTISAKTCIVRKSMQSKFKMGPVIDEGSFKTTTCIPSYSSGHREFKNLWFISVTQGIIMGAMWVCLWCSRHTQNHDNFFSKTAFIHIRTVDYTAKNYSLLHLLITHEHFKQIPTVYNNTNKSYACECKRL